MARRLYKSGTIWCFWRWTITDSEYITRLHIIKTPWFAICLHWLNKPDPEPHLHDHPVSFLSFILRGFYKEFRLVGNSVHVDVCNRKWINFVRADAKDRHRIVEVAPKTLTLVLMGPKTREWGFHAPTGWIHWKEYYTHQRLEKANKNIAPNKL